MATPSSPFSFLDGLFDRIGSRLRPPTWAVHEIQQRAVLFLNHVLQQEPEAQQRLVRQKGRVVRFEWRFVTLQLVATPAGLLDLAPEGAVPELTLIVTETSPLKLAGATLRGDKPSVRIVGDVQLAAEVNWLVDHVRWDVEDDLARVIGDVPAHTLGNVARRVAAALRQFVGKAAGGPGRPGAAASGGAGRE
ncbi:ubiquinone biosynthesis accessory factor UbiJ [Variovorax sp. PvP013]|uniref:ubiquinone biosynthesis accessory factor UbiJ n=1 Tax=Variovorax sp. PvP013 TaxID=3156435 RepID=UPI003D24D60F